MLSRIVKEVSDPPRVMDRLIDRQEPTPPLMGPTVTPLIIMSVES